MRSSKAPTSSPKGKKHKAKFQEEFPTPADHSHHHHNGNGGHSSNDEHHEKEHMSSTKIRPGTPAPQKHVSPSEKRHIMHPHVTKLLADAEELHQANRTHRGILKKISDSIPAGPLQGQDQGKCDGCSSNTPMTLLPPRTNLKDEQSTCSQSFWPVKPPTTTIFKPAVVNGDMFVPNSLRPRPYANTFKEVHDLGPKDTTKKWLVNLDDFASEDLSFTIQGTTLKVEGTLQKMSIAGEKASEVISLPPNVDIDDIKVFLNRELSTLIVLVQEPPQDEDD